MKVSLRFPDKSIKSATFKIKDSIQEKGKKEPTYIRYTELRSRLKPLKEYEYDYAHLQTIFPHMTYEAFRNLKSFEAEMEEGGANYREDSVAKKTLKKIYDDDIKKFLEITEKSENISEDDLRSLYIYGAYQESIPSEEKVGSNSKTKLRYASLITSSIVSIEYTFRNGSYLRFFDDTDKKFTLILGNKEGGRLYIRI